MTTERLRGAPWNAKLARKILVPVLATLLAVIGVATWEAVRAETEQFEADLHADHVALGRVIAASAPADAAAWRRGLEGTRLQVDVGPLPDGVRVGATTRADGQFETWIPIEGGAGRAVRIREPESDLVGWRDKTLRHWLFTASALAFFAVLVVFMACSRLLARPIAELADLARRIGSGDLAPRHVFTSDDELGALGRELTRMAVDLAEANRRVAVETDRRFAAVHALRHADRLGTVGQLAAGIAHELGTPLNVVGGRAQLVEADVAATDDTRRSARVIGEQVTRMSQIIRQLLDFARMKPSDTAVSRPVGVAEKAIDLLRSMARAASVELALDASPEARALEAPISEGLLGQVIANLVVNAIHASEGTGTRIVVRVLSIEAASPLGGEVAPRVAIAVEDHGRGIDPAHIEHVFEPFFTTKDVGKGSGLGLSVSYGITRDAGGWIEVASRLGEGATFTVVLPLVLPRVTTA